MANDEVADPVPPRRCPSVGPQVRYWRQSRGLTLAQVAERSGLNLGYLSQIENEKASPSLDTLAALGAALEVPITWFLVSATPAPRVVRRAERRVLAAPEGGRFEVVDAGLAGDLRIQYFSAPPGTASGVRTHIGEEHHILLSGRLRCTQGAHVLDLGPGDYMVWDATLPHEAICVGADVATGFILTHRPHLRPLTGAEGR